MRSIFRLYLISLTTILLFLTSETYSVEKRIEKEFTNSIGMSFVRINSGEFLMGVGDRLLPEELRKPFDKQERSKGTPQRRYGDFDEWPRHKVTIRQDFYMGGNRSDQCAV